jgi:hypothetical protein
VTPPNRRNPLRVLGRTPWAAQQATWRDARPGLIDAALKRATARPTGNWYVLADSRRIRASRPFGRTVAGTEVVAWRDRLGRLLAGPGACPHLGAPLCRGTVDDGALLCHWHGLRLDRAGAPGWAPFPAADDGALAWVRLDQAGGEAPTPRPRDARRPPRHARLDTVTETVGGCEPQDVVANRLDPWHGAWFHPYAFTRLRVLETPDPADGDRFLVEVSYRLGSRLAVPVQATFTAPGPRTVVMEITDGEGATSVVETHATPLTPPDDPRPRTAVIEAVLATSPRRGFTAVRAAAPLLRPLVRRAAARLWRDDLAYAERRWHLRSTGRFPDAS